MAESTKPVRLSKVAREFNLGMTTVVDFLASKGIEVEAKPNTKLDPATYALVRSNFQGDKETKQKAQRSATGIQERESITLASAKKRTALKQEEEEPEIDLSQFRKSEAAPVVKRTKPAEAAPVTPPAPKKAEVAPKPEAPVAPKATAPAAEPVKPAAEAADKPAEKGVKVVGKVDLEALKPKKKAPAKAEANKEEAVAKAAPEPAAEASQPAAPEAPAKPTESEVVRAKAEKLTGPTVVGKIELPVERKKTAKTGEDGKRKRVRVKKVDVAKAGGPAGRADTRGRGRRNEPKKEVSQEDIQKEIRATLARLSGGKKSKSSKLRRQKRDAIQQRHEESNLQSQLEESILKLTEFVTVAELDHQAQP